MEPPDGVVNGRHLAQFPVQTIRAAGVLLIQDQVGNTFDYFPGLYVMHSLAHSMAIFSIRNLGVVSLVSAARLNINRKLQFACSTNTSFHNAGKPNNRGLLDSNLGGPFSRGFWNRRVS